MKRTVKCKDGLFIYRKPCKGSYGVHSLLVVNGLQNLRGSTASAPRFPEMRSPPLSLFSVDFSWSKHDPQKKKFPFSLSLPHQRLCRISSCPRRRALYLVWCRAGIQAVGDNNNSKDLDSRFRGNDDVSLRFDTVSQGGGNFFRMAICLPSPVAGGGWGGD